LGDSAEMATISISYGYSSSVKYFKERDKLPQLTNPETACFQEDFFVCIHRRKKA
jgi:hypothetical protein